MGIFDKLREDNGKALCQMLHSHSDITDPQRKTIAQQTIERGRNIDDPLARLACAFAYAYLGAAHRKEAILQFETYLSAPVNSDDFSLWSVYGTLAELYEAELDFASAERFYILQEKDFTNTVKQKYKNAPDPMPNVKLGRLYLKMSVDRAVEYWQKVSLTSEYRKYSSFQHIVNRELADAKAKQVKGYVYKPRRKQ